ncbi:MAG: cysteine--tRNA ligase [Candidatus Hydrogenedentes bacterium]|nr:cysteine--tRNA ligase [Candidatus Hydrogenedentota bacterium]
MSIRLYNTLSRKKEVLEPLVPGKIGMYTCGPTVYSYAHVGNLRTFLFQDLLRRHLEYRGYEVTHVMNITDVEDKIIRACRETGEPREALTERYASAFFEDLRTLGVEAPEHCPRATDYIDEMVSLVEKLRAKDHTYEVDGSVYFKIGSFPDYGKLSHFDVDTLQQGASGRVEEDEYATDDPRDFALWKGYVEEDGDVFWETSIGKGRPGWHLECSCMSMAILGESFDIHCGAIDLVFPHHENEIAQSEAATGKPFVKYWLHAAHLNIDGRKISKSIGNVVSLRELLKDGHDAAAIQWALRATHYRQPTNFSVDTLQAAQQAVQRIREFRTRLGDVRQADGNPLEDSCATCEERFGAALDDDLNISGALGAVFDFVRDTNKLIDAEELGEGGARNALALLDRLDTVTGMFGDGETSTVPPEIEQLLDERQKARRSKDFARSDSIRDELNDLGWILKDTPEGPRLTKKI